jgi:hypothetical protein
MSNNYIAERLRGEKSFNLNDIAEIAAALDFEPVALLVAAEQPTNIVEGNFGSNVRGLDEDQIEQQYDTAANHDHSDERLDPDL